jgi:predicted DNA-binding transcriptional regulator YafY
MKADRLLAALLLLQAHGRMTGRELARRLEVSRRTVHRDMEALGAAGVPVFALRGAAGGWQLEEGWRTRVPGLDEAELRALVMAQPRVLGDAPLARAAERALDKLMASLPSELREQAASIRQRLHVDITSWSGRPEDLSALPVVQEAVARDRKLAFDYQRPGRERSARTVDPLGLVAKGGVWYLVAQTADGFRTYRVSRIEAARMLDQACERPADFDLAAYWRASTDELERERRQYTAVLRLEPRTADSLRHWERTSAVVEAPASADGWVTLQVHFHDEEHARFVALGLGARAVVLAPPSLCELVATEHAAALALAPP